MHAQNTADFRQPYIRTLEDYGDEYQARFRTEMGTIGSWTQQDWAVIESILAGIEALYYEWSDEQPGRPSSSFGRVARVEFISKFYPENPRRSFQGAVLFDNYQRPLFHATNALLGYGGSGPMLSRDILMAIGVPEEMFEEVNQAVEPHQYDNVIFSRETIGVMIGHSAVIGGVLYSDIHRTGDIITNPGDPVSDTWTWWLA